MKYLIRNVIQTAALATIWSIGALVAWFWLKRVVVYSVFDITSGTVYTHVSDPLWRGYCYLKTNIQAIFDTLISRTQLRDRMATTSARVDLGYSSNSSQVWPYFDSPNVWPN